MGRVREEIDIAGRRCWALFDTGARNTYVDRSVASLLTTTAADKPFRTGLGGRVREANEVAVLNARIEGHPVSTHAFVLDEIGNDEDGKAIEVLFGALAMQ